MPANKNTSDGNVYRPSGKIGDLAWILWLIVSLTLIPLVSALYAFITWWMPTTFFNPLFTFLFASFGLPVIHNILVLEYGHVRNFAVARQMGVGAFVIAMFSQWTVWLALTESEPFWNVLSEYGKHPVETLNQFIHVYHTGTWWGPGGTWSGWLLALVWLIEAIWIYRSLIYSVMGKVKEPYSEASNSWHVCRILPSMQSLSESAVNQIKSGNHEALVFLEKESSDQNHSEIKLYYSPAQDYYISISNKIKKEVENAGSGFDSRLVISHLLISQAAGHHLRQVLEGTPCYLKNPSFNKDLITSFGFSGKEVQGGEMKYRNATSDTLRNRLVWVDRVWHPRLGQINTVEFYGKIPPETVLALIAFIQHEPANVHKHQLAKRFSDILNDSASEFRQVIFKIADAWYEVERDTSIQNILSNGLCDFAAQTGTQTNAKNSVQEEINTEIMPTEFSYKCRPGYGSKELLIEIAGAEDEFFLQDFLNIISEIHPKGSPGLDEMHTMLSSGDVEWEGETDFGKISFNQNVYGSAFVHGEGNDRVIAKIDEILKANSRFSRIEVNFDDYKRD